MRSTPKASRRLAVAAATLFLAAGGATSAAHAEPRDGSTPPSVSAPTVFLPGETTPVDIGGNDLHAGDAIRKGTELLRFKVTLNGPSDTPVALRAPSGYIH